MAGGGVFAVRVDLFRCLNWDFWEMGMDSGGLPPLRYAWGKEKKREGTRRGKRLRLQCA